MDAKGFVRTAWCGHWRERELALGTLSPSFTSAQSVTSREPLCGVGCNPVLFRSGPESSTEVLLCPGLLAFCVNLSMRNFKSIHLPPANARSCQWQLDNPVVASLQLLWDPVEWFRGERDWFHEGLPLAARVRLVICSQCAFSSQVWMLSLERSPRVQLFSAQECPALFFGASRTTASLKFNPLEKEKTAVALGMNFRHVC